MFVYRKVNLIDVRIYIYIEYVNKYDNKITNCFCIHIYKYNI